MIEDMLETRSCFRLFVFVSCFSVLVHLCKFSVICEYYGLVRDIVMISSYCSSLFFCVVFSIFCHSFVFCEQGQMVLSRRIYASGKDWRDILVQGGGNAHNQVIYSPHINVIIIFTIYIYIYNRH